jgi:hypothetical protein
MSSPSRPIALYVDTLLNLTAAMPLCCYVFLYTFFIRARLALGYWPSPYKPDPKDLAFDVHHAIIWQLFTYVPLTAVAWLLLLPLWRQLTIPSRFTPRLLLFLLSWTIWWTLLLRDPGEIMEWFCD